MTSKKSPLELLAFFWKTDDKVRHGEVDLIFRVPRVQLEGSWDQLKGTLQEQPVKLTIELSDHPVEHEPSLMSRKTQNTLRGLLRNERVQLGLLDMGAGGASLEAATDFIVHEQEGKQSFTEISERRAQKIIQDLRDLRDAKNRV